MKICNATILSGMAFATLVAGCDRGAAPAANGVLQTKYPGQVSAGGLASGQLMARTARDTTDAIYAGGTPGIAGGAGGNTSGAAIGGATRETGQGPSSGVTRPSGTGGLGTSMQAGDNEPAATAQSGGAQAPAGNAPPATAPLTPAQAAAAKKAEADARAAKEKEALNAGMERIAVYWRQRAAQEDWRIKPPPPVTGPTGIAASDPPSPSARLPAGAGSAAAAPATAAAPLSARALHAANVPVKSEKLGTARPSEDVKAGPTRSEPAGTPPTVNRPGVPDNAPKQ